MHSVKVRTVSCWFLSALLAGCAAEDDGADNSSQDITGGNSSVESPTVYLFDGADRTAPARCAGALIADTFVVTAKACAKEGMSVGRAIDSTGSGIHARILTVNVP